MFHYVTDTDFLSRIRNLCGGIMQDLCHQLKEDCDIGTTFCLVGSGARNLIVQNESQPVDLDYNLEILRCADRDERIIKKCVRKSLNKVLNKRGWGDCEDSTSSLTTEKRCFVKGNPTNFSMDVCIVRRDEKDVFYRLIHQKTGFTLYDRYYWNMASSDKSDKGRQAQTRGRFFCLRQRDTPAAALAPFPPVCPVCENGTLKRA